MKENKRMLTIVLVATLQLIMLLSSVSYFFYWLDEKSKTSAVMQIRESNHCYVDQAISRIQNMSIENLENGSVGWQRLQSYIEKTQLPNRGFFVALDSSTGKIIAHPESKKSPEIHDLTWQQYCSKTSARNQPIEHHVLDEMLENRDAKKCFGTVQLGSSSHCVDCRRIEHLNMILLVNQVCEANHCAVGSIENVQKFAFYGTLFLGFAGIGLTYNIGRRLEKDNKATKSHLQCEVANRKNELVKTQSAIIFGLAKLAESRDTDTGEHLERIRKYVTILANDLAEQFDEIDEEYIQHLGLASSLHDIGKVGIPDAILLKPGRLTDAERSLMQLHASLGGECLDAIGKRLGENNFLQMAREVAYWHHERWDGTGYPHQLEGTRIPISARIVSVADVYDALTSRRPYKEPMSHEKSREIIVGGSGTQFDPQVVEAFLRHQEAFQAVAAKYNSAEAEKPLTMLLQEKLAATSIEALV